MQVERVMVEGVIQVLDDSHTVLAIVRQKVRVRHATISITTNDRDSKGGYSGSKPGPECRVVRVCTRL